MKSQKDRILQHMQKGKTITTYQAYAKFRSTSLRDRIRDLERDGWVVDRQWKKIRKGVQVKEYRLHGYDGY